MAISVVVAVEPVADELIEKITSRMATLRIGDGRRNCDMGPLVTRQHRDKVASYIDVAIEDGAKVVVDGRNVNVDGDENGFWLGPTLIDDVPLPFIADNRIHVVPPAVVTPDEVATALDIYDQALTAVAR